VARERIQGGRKAGAVVVVVAAEGGKPMCDDGWVDVFVESAAPWLLILVAGDVAGRADAVRAIYVAKGAVVVGGGKPVCDDGRVDVRVHVTEMFAQVRLTFRPIFVLDLY
jgi:hypothetical protein